MVLKSLRSPRTLRAGASVALLTGFLAACSGSGPTQDDAAQEARTTAPESTPAAPEPAQTREAPPAPTQTMPMEDSSAAAQPAAQSSGPVLQESAPQTYTVKSGDTLWDIANTFLRDPWFWPDIWYVNPHVENPHLIYAADVLAMVTGGDGQPEVRLERGSAGRLSPRVRSTPLEGPVNAIPYEIVAAFMSKPSVLDKDQVKNSPYVVSSRDQHLVMATGNTIYARGKIEGENNTRYAVVHVGDELRDPDNNDLLGYQGIYTGTARLTRQGDPASLEVIEAVRETVEGDKVLATDMDVPLDFIPHAPANPQDGRIISIVNGVSMVGQYQVVVINRGKAHGLEPGHVLTIQQAGPTVVDRNINGKVSLSRSIGQKVTLPDEPAGTFMVFKTYDRLSYGLVMEAVAPIHVMD